MIYKLLIGMHVLKITLVDFTCIDVAIARMSFIEIS